MADNAPTESNNLGPVQSQPLHTPPPSQSHIPNTAHQSPLTKKSAGHAAFSTSTKGMDLHYRIVHVPKFHTGCMSPFCRSTRRSLAYDPSTNFPSNAVQEADSSENATLGESSASVSPKKSSVGTFFMKDHWREPSQRTSKPEADTYRLLEQEKVEHVAKMETGGEVVARTQEPCFLEHSRGRSYHHLTIPLQCHHIFLRTVARDLTLFLNCKTLVLCIADAMKAAQQAFDRARILHRDISLGNIMIAHDRGILIDWDLCLVLDSDVTTHRAGRTGTWQFVSVHLLLGGRGAGDDAGKQTGTDSVIDDRESAFWVLFYIALRYLKHDLSETELFNVLDTCFDASGVDNQHRDVGKSPVGIPKLAVLKELASNRGGVPFEIRKLNDLLHELAKSLVYRYVDPEDTSAEQQSAYEILLTVCGPNSGPVKVNPYYKYVAAQDNMEGSTTWFYETLRAHADEVPLPPPDTNDEHIKDLYPPGGLKRKFDERESDLPQNRVTATGGNHIGSSQQYVSHLDPVDEEVRNSKKKKTKK